MAGSRRSLYNLITVCCLLAGSLLPLPGNGQNGSSASSSRVSQFTFPQTEAGSTQATATSMDMIMVTPEFNVSSVSPSEYLIPTTLGSLNSTISIQTTNYVTNGSASSFLTPTTNILETNQSSLDDKKYIHTTLVTPSIKILPTEISQSNEMKGPTTAPQPESSTVVPMGTAKNRLENMLVMDHKALTDENVVDSTSAPSPVVDEQALTVNTSSTTISLTFEVAFSTILPHKIVPAETEQPANQVEKPSVSEVEDNEDQSSLPEASPVGKDPLVIAVVIIFVVTIGSLSLMCFLRYRQHINRLQFRHLQDLPMDDMMEDAPLSLYNY